ncbi:MAG: T9SS type A sorting domain-containing protein [Saprospiraceae bacterium]
MKNFKVTLLFLFISLLSIPSLFAQNNYTEYQLPHPNYVSPLFVGSLTESAIYYGKTPSYSSNKPVIVFVHGFIDLANLWFAPGNDMYKEAYKDRYRTAYVAMTRGEGMWKNGELLAEMLEDITAHYGVSDVVIVAHSNGGKASEVAMFYENKSHLVNRVISLGTPFKGTGVADLAETPAFNWLVDFIGLGGGTSTSTTYYMEGVARPILDNEPDNQANKFINFGAWGYNNGTTITAPVMLVSGGLLNNMGAGPSTGGNDGVTPYYSSTRPGGNPQWPGYCFWWWCNNESQYDHIDITFDYVVWDEIRPYFTGNLNSFRKAQNIQEIKRGKFLESNFELISTMDGDVDEFTVGKDAGAVSISLMHQEEGNQFFIVDEDSKPVNFEIQTRKGHSTGMNSDIRFLELQAGKYSISTDADHFAAMVSYEKGPKLVFDNDNISFYNDEAITFQTQIHNTDERATLTGAAIRKTDLMGNAIEEQSFVIEFDYIGKGTYTYSVPQGLGEGVYNLTINAEGETFRRTVVSGFAVTAAKKTETVSPVILALSNFPNPVVENTTIQFEIIKTGDAYLYLYDAYGRVVSVENVSSYQEGIHKMNWNMSHLNNGTYFLELRNGNHKTTTTIVKVK